MRRSVVDGALYGLSKIAPGLIMFATIPIWLRLFGEVGYGLYSIAWSAAAMSGAFCTGWIRQGLLRYTGDTTRSLQSLPRWTIWASITVSIVPPLLMLWPQVNDKGSPQVGLDFLAGALIFTIVNSIYLVLQAQAQREVAAARFALSEIVRALGALLASLAFANLSILPGYNAILISYVLSTAFAIVIIRPAAGAKTAVRRGASSAEALWSYGWPMAVWLGLASALLFLDRQIIGLTLGPDSAGSYSATSDMVVRGIGMLTFPITMLAHPRIMKVWNSNKKREALLINRQFGLLMVAVLGLCVLGGIMYGTQVIELILSISLDSSYMVPYLVLGAAFWQIALMAHKPLELMNRTKTLAFMLLSIVTLTVGANFLFLPVFGVTASAIIFCAGAFTYVISVTCLSQILIVREGI